MKDARYSIIAIACFGICAGTSCLHGDTAVWQAVTNNLAPSWKTAANWAGGSIPALDGGHDIDFTGPSVVTLSADKIWENQMFERVQIPYVTFVPKGTVLSLW